MKHLLLPLLAALALPTAVKAAREEYKKLLEEGWKKTSIFNSYF